uniref:Homeobox domain-containing protein n=1 Tax=Parascaris equorum TaxID=6256 RepID=A0A914R1B0_PAREQ
MLFPKALDLHRPKRPRTTFSATQLAELEKEYEHNPYLIGEERANLAEKLNLTDTQSVTPLKDNLAYLMLSYLIIFMLLLLFTEQNSSSSSSKKEFQLPYP